MKSIKSRFLKRFRTPPPSTYTSKQHVLVPLRFDSSDRLSCSQTLHDVPNSIQQEHRTNTELFLGEPPNLYLRKKNSPLYDLEMAKETDVFEECECEFDDSMPELVSSSSSSSCSSSPCDSPTRIDCTSFIRTENLSDFEEKCPPGGGDRVILYTTSLTGIRKTYEDCHAIKFLLDSFRVVYFEKDVSMHLEFRDELWRVLGEKSVPPRLFIKGRYIGGADQVVTLHEIGMLKMLLQGMPVLASGSNLKCRQCGGVGFLLCLDCHGSCKIYKGDQKDGLSLFGRCPKCNENGLIKCSTCSY